MLNRPRVAPKASDTAPDGQASSPNGKGTPADLDTFIVHGHPIVVEHSTPGTAAGWRSRMSAWRSSRIR